MAAAISQKVRIERHSTPVHTACNSMANEAWPVWFQQEMPWPSVGVRYILQAQIKGTATQKAEHNHEEKSFTDSE